MRWLASAWRGDFATSVRVCVEAAGDERLRPATRDLFVAIAVLDHFSLTDATADSYGLVPRALEVAERTDVALTRVSCLLGVAWALADRDPGRSVALVRRALDDIGDVPALTRLTLPGSASRLLSRLDPRIAAEALLDQLAATPRRGSYVDVIPLFYGAVAARPARVRRRPGGRHRGRPPPGPVGVDDGLRRRGPPGVGAGRRRRAARAGAHRAARPHRAGPAGGPDRGTARTSASR